VYRPEPSAHEMSDSASPDHYETLQVSPHADGDTLDRMFRHLAKRYHPDNADSGDAARFAQVMESFRVLSDPASRADYDMRLASGRERASPAPPLSGGTEGIEEDLRIRQGILSALYKARRKDVENPGIGALEMERVLGCAEAHMKFHIWYLRENGWVQRLPNGQFAITASGVDRALEVLAPRPEGRQRLTPGEGAGAGA